MSTDTVTSVTPSVHAGKLVTLTTGDTDAVLAIVLNTADDLATVIYRPGWGGAPVTGTVPASDLGPAPAELATWQWETAQQLIARFAEAGQDQAATLQDEAARLRVRADAAEQKIGAMRCYAIARHEDRDICRQGLDDFLVAHDLAPYEPVYSAQVTLHLDVEVHDVDDSSDAEWKVRDCLDVMSRDEDIVRISGQDIEQVTATRAHADA
jgi:hypothetical protein